MTSARTLLFLTTDLPYPPTSGGTIKSWRLLEFLSEHFEVTLVCTKGGTRENLEQLQRKLSIPVHGFDLHKERSALAWLSSLVSASSLNAWRNHSKEIKHLVEQLAAPYDLVFADHLEVMDLIAARFRSKTIYHSHNAEFKLWQEVASRQSSPVKKWVANLEAKRIASFEKRSIESTHMTFAAPNDQSALTSELSVPANKLALTYHLGNDQLLELPAIDVSVNEKHVFYAGTLSWEPNRDGLQWFLENVWPLVIRQEPEAVLKVCGKGADDRLLELLNSGTGVNYLGFVDDLERVMSACRVAVVPLRFGSGMKIKTFDALYRGLPLVTTPTGADGIDLEHQKHAMIADDPANFAEHIQHLLSQPEQGARMAKDGRLLVRENYTYTAMFAQMLSSIQS